jgi:hypothetical protein
VSRLLAITPLIALLATAAPARADEPSTTNLVLAGSAMALPTYALGVAWHEGSHALWAKLCGAEILELRLYPSMYKGHFYFGLTKWRGEMTRGERAWTLLAPKLTNLVLLGTYTTLLFTDALPDNEYGQLALAVVATGAWVDFSKDIVSFNPTNDTIKVHALFGRTREAQRWPYRLAHLVVSAGAAFILHEGYARVFDRPPATVTLLTGEF